MAGIKSDSPCGVKCDGRCVGQRASAPGRCIHALCSALLAWHAQGISLANGRAAVSYVNCMCAASSTDVCCMCTTASPVVRPVLHELAGQLDRVPLHAADAGHQALALLGQHVLQRVPRLVEQRLNLSVDTWQEGQKGI